MCPPAFVSIVLAVPAFCVSLPISGLQAADTRKPLTAGQVWSLDGTYTDQQHGLTFRYPSVWKPATQFGYVPPSLTAALGPNDNQNPGRVAGFAYSAGGFPRQGAVGPYTASNLEGFGVVYSVLPATTTADCKKKVASVVNNFQGDHPGHSSVTVAGRSYSVYQTRGEAMNQTYAGKLYATYNDGACYLFETGVAAALPGVLENIRALTPAQLHDIDMHLWRMMETVRIVPKR